MKAIDLIERYVDEPGPGSRGPRLRDSGVELWALIAQMPAFDNDAARAAAAYDVPREAIEAALAYYQRHKSQIDAQVAVQLS